MDQLPGLLLSPLALRRLKRRKLAELSRDGFDAAHGTDTAAILVGRELGPCVTRAGHLVIPYETTSEAAIRMALDGLDADFSRAVFVDLGCGKGKPLMVAASYPFRRLVGVDVSPACIAVARRNVAQLRAGRDRPERVELRVQDAEDFAFPAEPLVVYLYNPFPGAVLERVVANLEASLRESPRQVAVVYVNPHALSALRRSGPVRAGAGRSPTGCRWRLEGMPGYERAAVFVTTAAAERRGEAPAALPT